MSNNRKYDITIAGGSLGGTIAAFRAAESGKTVYISEATDWLGGQLTSQAVPPDEHKWIEQFGRTESYAKFRDKVREHYRNHPMIIDGLKTREHFCPGGSWVSRVSHEPKVAVKILNEMLAPYVEKGLITIDYFTVPDSAEVAGDTVRNVTFRNLKTQELTCVESKVFLDATDCGDLLPVTGTEYNTGAEGKPETGELHAPEVARHDDMQPITWVVALELTEDEDYIIPKPVMYDYFREYEMSYDNAKLLSWYAPDAETRKKGLYAMFDNENPVHKLGLWSYRRVIFGDYYKDKRADVSLINWPQNDFALGNIYDDIDAERNLEMARQQTLSLVYWLQTEAPRADGGKGYKVKPRGDVMGTDDGLAKAPYIRESRRIKAIKTVTEEEVSRRYNKGICKRSDSVGVGHYAIDVHLTTKTHTFLYDPTYPFEIPLSAMIPVRVRNLIPACKNVGCTHLTNGCYRLHPVEWNIGEVAGLLAAYCVEHNCLPREVLEQHLTDFQQLIMSKGVEIHWPEDRMELN